MRDKLGFCKHTGEEACFYKNGIGYCFIATEGPCKYISVSDHLKPYKLWAEVYCSSCKDGLSHADAVKRANKAVADLKKGIPFSEDSPQSKQMTPQEAVKISDEDECPS